MVDGQGRLPPESSRGEEPTSPRAHRPPSGSKAGEGRVDPLIGRVLAGCRIIEEIDRGGMGVVYKAVQIGTNRPVAVKTVLPERMDRDRIDAFIREARLLANNQHEDLVIVYDAGVAGEVLPEPVPFLVMEHLPDARSIIDYAQSAGLSTRARVDAFLKICKAVQHLHSRGIVHFDIKPANVLVDGTGRIRLTDLGLARTLAESSLVRPGGTFTHMSPEQLVGDPGTLDSRCDVYALGVVLYELLTGRLPYYIPRTPDGRVDATEAYNKLIETTPPSLADIDPGLADLAPIVAKAIEPRRERRYSSVERFASDLDSVVKGWDRPEKRRLPVGALLASVAIVAISTLVAHYTAPTLFAEWTPLQRWWTGWLTHTITTIAPHAPLQNVGIVALTDDTDLDRLAHEHHIELNPKDGRSLRRLHGLLCRTLAGSGARCIAFDIGFSRESEYDDDFAAGIDAAVDAGIPIVIGARNWTVDDKGRPRISPRLWRRGVDWGGYQVSRIGSTDEIWIPLFVRTSGSISPSLSIAAYASVRAKGAQRDLAFDPSTNSLELSFWRTIPERPDKRIAAGPSEPVPLTMIQPYVQGTVVGGRSEDMRSGDIIGLYRPAVFERASLENATHEYSDVIDADPLQLRRWFADRIVIVGDERSKTGDYLRGPDGAPMPGTDFHAVGVESLMRHLHSRVPDQTREGILLTAAASAMGVIVVFPRRRRAGAPGGPARRLRHAGIRVVALGVGVLAIIAFSLVAYDQFTLLWSPFKPILGLLLAFCIALFFLPRPKPGAGLHR